MAEGGHGEEATKRGQAEAPARPWGLQSKWQQVAVLRLDDATSS